MESLGCSGDTLPTTFHTLEHTWSREPRTRVASRQLTKLAQNSEDVRERAAPAGADFH